MKMAAKDFQSKQFFFGMMTRFSVMKKRPLAVKKRYNTYGWVL
jgi:hypothetical protein